MWSKTKQALMSQMAYCLKNRIRYNFEVYTTNKCRWWSETPVFYIYVDNKLWFASNPKGLSKEMEYFHENMDKSLPYHKYWAANTKTHPAASDYASEYGLMGVDHIMLYIHKYLNVYGVRECLNSEDYILKMFAVLDKRVGKRTMKKLVDNISNEPEWFRKFIILRAESEGIHCQTFPGNGIMRGKTINEIPKGEKSGGTCRDAIIMIKNANFSLEETKES